MDHQQVALGRLRAGAAGKDVEKPPRLLVGKDSVVKHFRETSQPVFAESLVNGRHQLVGRDGRICVRHPGALQRGLAQFVLAHVCCCSLLLLLLFVVVIVAVVVHVVYKNVIKCAGREGNEQR